MTAEELLKTRFQIIADYPGNNFGPVGTILDRDWAQYPNDDETQEPIWRISQFPHLFMKMDWWEGRPVEQMPKRVKSIYDDIIREIVKWEGDHTLWFGVTKIGYKNEYGAVLRPHCKFIPVD